MNVAEIIAHADALGVRLYADGGELKAQWRTDAAPPPGLVAALKANKPAILSALAPPPFASSFWRDYFEERAAIREHDGGLTRTDAEARALEDVAQVWLAKNPLAPSSRAAGCVFCGGAAPDTPVLANEGHAWLHHYCWAPLLKRREAQAGQVIARLVGIA